MEARQLFIEQWTEIIGTTQPLPERSARVSAAIEGRVVSLLENSGGKPIAEGDLVQKGQALIRLDDAIARAARDKAEADQRALEQEVEQSRLGVDLAAIEFRRLEELDKKSVPGSQRLVQPVELEKARVAVEDAKSKMRGAELKAKAGDKQLKALEEQLKLYTLTAPISGRLGRIFVVKGQTLSPSAGTPAAEIVDIDKEIDLLCFVPPNIVRRLKEGQPVRIQMDSAEKTEDRGQKSEAREQKPEGQELEVRGQKSEAREQKLADGRIVYIANQSEMDTGNFAVKARFSNTGRTLRSNVSLRALALTAPGRPALTLPESALMEDQDPPAVIVVEDHHTEKNKEGKEMEVGKARKLRAKVGIRDQVLHLVEILAVDDPEKKWQGTLDTAKFVVERGQGLRNGDQIRLEEEDEDEAAPAEQKTEDKGQKTEG
jgi:RND family efflux transporter MFP subunit